MGPEKYNKSDFTSQQKKRSKFQRYLDNRLMAPIKTRKALLQNNDDFAKADVQDFIRRYETQVLPKKIKKINKNLTKDNPIRVPMMYNDSPEWNNNAFYTDEYDLINYGRRYIDNNSFYFLPNERLAETLAHEMGHYLDSHTYVKPKSRKTQLSSIYTGFKNPDSVLSNEKYGRKDVANAIRNNDETSQWYKLYHDAFPQEQFADLIRMKYMQQNENIYDSFSGVPYTQSNLDDYLDYIHKRGGTMERLFSKTFDPYKMKMRPEIIVNAMNDL